MVTFFDRLKTQIKTGNIRMNEPMSKHTNFKIGGPCDCMYFPAERRELIEVLRAAKNAGVPVTVIGNGSNLLVNDRGIRGLVVKIAPPFDTITQNREFLTAQSGVLLSRLAAFAQKAGLSGLEFASGIPGTLGGAVYMNAGAYDGVMQDVITETVFLDENLREKIVSGKMHQFDYRKSMFQGKPYILLESTIKLAFGDKSAISSKMKDLNRRRREKQPLKYPSAGSTFARPPGDYASRLIDEAGLKGYQSGGAQVSPKHAGFVINTGKATFQDVMHVIEHVQQTVFEQFGVTLEPEVKIIQEEAACE